MAKVYKCDRCGKYYYKACTSKYRIILVSDAEKRSGDYTPLDLCYECTKKLVEWMKEEK